MRKILRSRRAEEDLLAIWLYIARLDQAAADRVLGDIEQGWHRLSRYPQAGVARDDLGVGIRHLVTRQYLTLYRETDAAIEIVRVLHGRRDIKPTDI